MKNRKTVIIVGGRSSSGKSEFISDLAEMKDSMVVGQFTEAGLRETFRNGVRTVIVESCDVYFQFSDECMLRHADRIVRCELTGKHQR